MLAVVKIGGSVITRKSEPETVDYDNLRLASRVVAEYTRRGGRLVLVIGGGSFGHYAVSKILEAKSRMEAADSSVIQLSMLKLAGIVASRLLEEGVAVTVHPPHTLCGGGCGRVCDYSPVARDLGLGLVPLVYGDAVPCGDSVEIVSGDDLASDIASFLRADCLIFVTSAPGVLSRDGRVLPVVGSIEEVEVLSSPGFDVTGGIVRKVEKALKASRIVGNVRIVGLHDLMSALEGGSVGTKIEKQ